MSPLITGFERPRYATNGPDPADGFLVSGNGQKLSGLREGLLNERFGASPSRSTNDRPGFFGSGTVFDCEEGCAGVTGCPWLISLE